MPQHLLPHSERLRSLGAIRRLFGEGQSGFVYPFRYVWYAEADALPSVEVLFSVPKKFHKRANKRNLLRRRTKEAYRLHKLPLHVAAGVFVNNGVGASQPAESSRVGSREGAPGTNLDLTLIYSSKEVLSYKKIEYAVQKILEQIAEHL